MFLSVILLHYGQTSFGTISLQVERFEDVSLKCSVEEKDYKKASVRKSHYYKRGFNAPSC